MVFSNPLSFSFAIPDISGKHKDKTIITNSHYTILNICLISDILQKYHHFLAEMFCVVMFGLINVNILYYSFSTLYQMCNLRQSL